MTCMFSDWKLTNLKDIPQIPWPWCQLGWQSRERGERRRGQVHAELLPPEWFRKPPTSRTGTPAILGEYQADQVLVDTQGQLVTQGDHPRGGNERPIHTKPLALAHLGYVVSKNIEIQVGEWILKRMSGRLTRWLFEVVRSRITKVSDLSS